MVVRTGRHAGKTVFDVTVRICAVRMAVPGRYDRRDCVSQCTTGRYPVHSTYRRSIIVVGTVLSDADPIDRIGVTTAGFQDWLF